jgi:hypothetical protein
MLGFEIDFWGYATFVVFLLTGLGTAIFIAGLPVQTIARKHPNTEAKKIMSCTGFLSVVPWIQGSKEAAGRLRHVEFAAYAGQALSLRTSHVIN